MEATAVKTGKGGSVAIGDPLGALAQLMAEKTPSLAKVGKAELMRALQSALGARDERARSLRRDVQIYLICADDESTFTVVTKKPKMLSTEQAAKLMGRSRPHVAMLIDAEKLAGATITPKGHRRVPETSVRAWIQERDAQSASTGDTDYRKAAREAGMYAIPESAFVQVEKKASKRG
jgi:excisionase family DNA binding protein